MFDYHHHHRSNHVDLDVVVPIDDEPVSLAEARQHLEIDDDNKTQDSLIIGLIAAARASAETEAKSALTTRTLKLTLDRFPRSYGGEVDDVIRLPMPPTQSVTSIKYTDTAGVEQTLVTDTDYFVAIGRPTRIVPAYGKCWPVTQRQIAAVRIVFVAGLAQLDEVPESAKRWMLMLIGSAFANREATSVDTRIAAVDMSFHSGLLDPVRFYG